MLTHEQTILHNQIRDEAIAEIRAAREEDERQAHEARVAPYRTRDERQLAIHNYDQQRRQHPEVPVPPLEQLGHDIYVKVEGLKTTEARKEWVQNQQTLDSWAEAYAQAKQEAKQPDIHDIVGEVAHELGYYGPEVGYYPLPGGYR